MLWTPSAVISSSAWSRAASFTSWRGASNVIVCVADARAAAGIAASAAHRSRGMTTARRMTVIASRPARGRERPAYGPENRPQDRELRLSRVLIALAAPVEQAHALRQQPRRARLVGEHVDVALEGEARHQQRLRAAVLADPGRAVARAEAGILPAAHRQLERDVVDLRVVDADRARLHP